MEPDTDLRRRGLPVVSLILLAVLCLLGTACELTVNPEQTGGTGPTPTDQVTTTTLAIGAPEPPVETLPSSLDSAVDQAFASYGPWQAREIEPFTDERQLVADTFNGQDREVISCAPALEPRTFRPGVFDQFAAFPFATGVLPGLIVEGSRIEDGDLNVLPLDRSPLPLVVDLASEAPTVLVDDPNPSSLQEAVAQLMRDADARRTGLSVVPANIRFIQSEVHSYEEAVLAMGVSLRYDSPDLQGEFKSAFEQQSGTEKHSVMVRLLQPMFTISVDRSGIRTPGDYLDPATTLADIQQLEGQGRLGSESPPVLIDAVTYGRVVYMTVTSTKVTNTQELTAAISASWGNVSGSAEYSEAHKNILESADIRVEAYGGNDDIALAALEEGTIQGFMEQVDTSTAAPLSMVLRTLDNTQLTIEDAATINDIGCTRTTKPDDWHLVLDLTEGAWADLVINGTSIKTYKEGSHRIGITGHLRSGSNNTVQLVYRPPTCIAGSMTTSFLRNGATPGGQEWRIEGIPFGEWACQETGTWHIDTGPGSVGLASGPPALRPT